MIQVLERFHTIISRIAHADGKPVQVKDLANELGVSSPTCSNILRSMCELGWVEPASGQKGYLLGPTPFQISGGQRYRQDLVTLATPIIEDLGNELQEFVNLVMNRNGRRHLLVSAQPERDIVLKPDLASGADLYQHTTGLAILAHMTKEQRDSYAEAFGPPTKCPIVKVPSAKKFEQICSDIRTAARVELELGPKDDSKTVFAFPVLKGDTCEMAIGMQIPTYRLTPKTKKKLISSAYNASNTLADALSHL